MKLYGADRSELDEVYLGLTNAEARELRDALNELLETNEAGWHVHVMDETFWRAPGEGERVERQVMVYRAGDPALAPPFDSP